MKPDELITRLEGLRDVASRADEAAIAGARDAIKGVRVPGHRVSMSGSRIRVTGPIAPKVAERLAREAGKGAQASVRGLLP
jgi:hypothetical protein